MLKFKFEFMIKTCIQSFYGEVILDTIDDRANRQAQIAPGAVVVHMRQMGYRVKLDRLITRVGTRHVAFSTVDAKVLKGI